MHHFLDRVDIQAHLECYILNLDLAATAYDIQQFALLAHNGGTFGLLAALDVYIDSETNEQSNRNKGEARPDDCPTRFQGFRVYLDCQPQAGNDGNPKSNNHKHNAN